MATDSNVTDGVGDYTAAVLCEKLNIFSDSIQSGFYHTLHATHIVQIIQNGSMHPLHAESVLNTNTIHGLDITTKSEPGMRSEWKNTHNP